MLTKYESMNDALVGCVKACGGSKIVGAQLWPEKMVDAAQRHLLSCLDEHKAERLTPDHLLMLLRMARAKGCHDGIEYIASSLGYAQPVPIEPADEQAELQRQFIEAQKAMAAMVERMERINNIAPRLRAA